jgi:hypothetical protein
MTNNTAALLLAFATGVFALLSMAPMSHALVYVNMLYDEQSSTFYLGDLVVEGQTLCFDRDYQNLYGEVNGLDPGPPFIPKPRWRP